MVDLIIWPLAPQSAEKLMVGFCAVLGIAMATSLG